MDKIAAINLFLRVVRSGSFAKAAGQTGLSPTTASRLVRELEEAVGARLLNRSTRSLSLTDAGRKLFDFYRQVIEDLEAVETEAAAVAASAPALGRLRVALPHTFATKLLLAAISRYREDYPAVDLDIRLDDAPADLIRDGFDVAVRIAPALSASAVVRRISDIPIVLCASPDYLARRGTLASPRDLLDHECLIYSDNDPPDEWEFVRDGQPIAQRVRGTVRANNGELLRAFALSGHGIIFQPTFVVADEINSGRLIPLLAGYEPRPRVAYAVYPSRRFIPRRVRIFIEVISAALSQRETTPIAEGHTGK